MYVCMYVCTVCKLLNCLYVCMYVFYFIGMCVVGGLR